jgi:heat shock protein HslJ
MFIHWGGLALATIAMLLVGCQGVIRSESTAQLGSDPLNTTYTIENRAVSLVDGRNEELAAPNSSSKIITQVRNTPLFTDLNKDGIDDAVLVLTQSTGGSGTFYYVAAAIATPDGYEGTTALLLGDRIKPQRIEIIDTKARISFLTRGSEQSFADDPTVPRQMDVMYVAKDQRLAEVAIDFEGEADPNRMTLQMHPWTWIKTVFNNDTAKEPKRAGDFTLSFTKEGQVSGTSDCNNFHGTVTVEKHKIHFGENMAMTRKFCADSQEMEFIGMLQNASSFFFTSRGQLIIELKYDSGSMFFQ